MKKNIYGLVYSSNEKVQEIQKNGLTIFASFPEYESLQQTRNYILSALITLFLTLTATLGWNFVCKLYKQTKRLKMTRNKSIQSHEYIFIKLTNYLILTNILSHLSYYL